MTTWHSEGRTLIIAPTKKKTKQKTTKVFICLKGKAGKGSKVGMLPDEPFRGREWTAIRTLFFSLTPINLNVTVVHYNGLSCFKKKKLCRSKLNRRSKLTIATDSERKRFGTKLATLLRAIKRLIGSKLCLIRRLHY